MRDVARRADRSVTQVSRALNGYSDVSESTRRVVQEAAEALGYVPNIQARQLKMPQLRTGAVGIVLPATTLSFSYPFVGSLVAGFIREANGRRVEVDISTVSAESAELMTYKRAIQQRRVDGFLLLRTRRDDERIAFLRAEGVPFATFGRAELDRGVGPDSGGVAAEDDEDQRGDGSGVPYHPEVDDSDDCMLAVVQHLVELGHTRIGCVAEPAGFARSDLRRRSLLTAAADHGIAISPDDVVVDDFHQDSGWRGGHTLLGRDPGDRPTAVVGLNDVLAIGVIGAATERGLRVPEDVSVTGFDDVPLAALAQPPLTTLSQPAERIGGELAARLLDHIETGSPDRPAPLLLRPPLVVRRSTAAPS